MCGASRMVGRGAHARTVTWIRPRPALLFVLLATCAGCGGTTRPRSDTNAVKSGTATATVTPKARERVARAVSRKTRKGQKAPALQTGSAAAALAALPIKGRAPMTGYDRGQFGGSWSSVGGCDTRDRMLDRDLTAKTYLDDCRIESGKLNDPYTAARIIFERGGASEVDIDHVVALGAAWQTGAQQWSYLRRVRFANDPLNLLSVDASANRQKSDCDAATWLPPNKRYRCDYVARQVAVKTRYRAWVTPAEHDAIARVLDTCPGPAAPAVRPRPQPCRPHPHPACDRCDPEASPAQRRITFGPGTRVRQLRRRPCGAGGAAGARQRQRPASSGRGPRADESRSPPAQIIWPVMTLWTSRSSARPGRPGRREDRQQRRAERFERLLRTPRCRRRGRRQGFSWRSGRGDRVGAPAFSWT